MVDFFVFCYRPFSFIFLSALIIWLHRKNNVHAFVEEEKEGGRRAQRNLWSYHQAQDHQVVGGQEQRRESLELTQVLECEVLIRFCFQCAVVLNAFNLRCVIELNLRSGSTVLVNFEHGCSRRAIQNCFTICRMARSAVVRMT